MRGRVFVSALAAVVFAGRAETATFWLEAESVRERIAGPIAAPMLIKDDPLASYGSYIEVAAGNNSPASMSPAEGHASYRFTVETPGAFRIWARVIAPTTSDDSFWVTMNGGTPIRWNGIAPGSAWHWTQVKADGASSPAQFALPAGDHTVQIGYREDGTRLDVLVVTDDPAYNPAAPLSGPPDTPRLDDTGEWATMTGVSLTWNAVPGAQTYTVYGETGNVLASGLTGHRFRKAASVNDYTCLSVAAVAGTGTSAAAGTCNSSYGIQRRIYTSDLSWTPPMVSGDSGIGAAPGTPESLSAPAAKGRAYLDFALASATKMKVWMSGDAPNPDTDSFWVRLNNGPWIKWNNIPADFGCNVVHNSDAGGAPVVFNFVAGSNRFEVANRETGTTFWKMFFTEDLPAGPNCHD
jgi:hypothetical protein